MGTEIGQRFICECGATVQYTSACECETRGPFRCACGATGTTVDEEGT